MISGLTLVYVAVMVLTAGSSYLTRIDFLCNASFHFGSRRIFVILGMKLCQCTLESQEIFS